ncbi:MAG: hypothetical protein WC627_01180 [Legionella sp.]|jgi:hypothetical protein
MLRQFLIYLILSILIVLFAKYAQHFIILVDTVFNFINLKLSPIFNETNLGPISRKMIVLIIMPLLIVGIPALIYRLIKGREMPHLIAATWIVWTIVVLSDILIL